MFCPWICGGAFNYCGQCNVDGNVACNFFHFISWQVSRASVALDVRNILFINHCTLVSKILFVGVISVL